jgi:hypothetical protein
VALRVFGGARSCPTASTVLCWGKEQTHRSYEAWKFLPEKLTRYANAKRRALYPRRLDALFESGPFLLFFS